MPHRAATQPEVPDGSAVPAPGVCRRYAGIYAALWRNSLTREMGFQINFLLWLFVEFLWFALQLGFNSVIYLHTDTIGDWTKWQVVMLIGASHFIQQLFQTFFLVNCAQLSDLVHAGRMDFMRPPAMIRRGSCYSTSIIQCSRPGLTTRRERHKCSLDARRTRRRAK